jgi:Cu-Zn family superoxide dismutase
MIPDERQVEQYNIRLRLKGGGAMRYSSILATLLLAAACGRTQATIEPMESVLRDSSGADVGRVTLREAGQRIQVRVRVSGLPAGLHGMHLHEAGRCEGPGFQTAGGHLNPKGQMRHGHQNPQGPHLGDLGNLRVGDDGKADVTVEVAGAEARLGIRVFLGLGQNGLALVVHADRDDEVTDPAGNSGARIACAELR